MLAFGPRPPAEVAQAVWDGARKACGLSLEEPARVKASARKRPRAAERPAPITVADAVLERLVTDAACGRGWTVIAGDGPTLAVRSLRGIAFGMCLRSPHAKANKAWEQRILVCKCDSLRGPRPPAPGPPLLHAACESISGGAAVAFSAVSEGGEEGAAGIDDASAAGAASLLTRAASTAVSKTRDDAERAAVDAAMGRDDGDLACLALGAASTLAAVHGGAWHAAVCRAEGEEGGGVDVASDAVLLPGVLRLAVRPGGTDAAEDATAAGKGAALANMVLWRASDPPEVGALAAVELTHAAPTFVRKAAFAVAVAAAAVLLAMGAGCEYVPEHADGFVGVAAAMCRSFASGGASTQSVAVGAAVILLAVAFFQRMLGRPRRKRKTA